MLQIERESNLLNIRAKQINIQANRRKNRRQNQTLHRKLRLKQKSKKQSQRWIFNVVNGLVYS